VKDLALLSEGRDLKDVIIVDNKIESYSLHLDNGVPISSFYGDPTDEHLKLLGPYLLQLAGETDVRNKIVRDF